MSTSPLVSDRPPELIGGFVPRAHPKVTCADLDGEAVLYDERSGALHLLNLTAARIWACCDGSGSVDEIVSDLAVVYGIEPTEIRGQVLALVRDLLTCGLVQGDGGGKSPPRRPHRRTPSPEA